MKFSSFLGIETLEKCRPLKMWGIFSSQNISFFTFTKTAFFFFFFQKTKDSKMGSKNLILKMGYFRSVSMSKNDLNFVI